MKKTHLFLLYFLILCGRQVTAQQFNKYEKGLYVNKNDSLNYRILMPENFDPNKKYPVVIFLHGSGERGSDNQAQLTHGGNLFLKPEVRKKFPAIVIFPQCPKNISWANVARKPDLQGKSKIEFQKGGKPTPPMGALLGMINDLLKKPYVEKRQMYIGGLSMGGMGTYEVLRRKPKIFAAAFAICGGDNIANVRKYKKVPLWIFHGGKDDVVSFKYSKAIADQLKIIGKEVKYTLYQDAGHNSWDPAFAEPQLLPWLFSHQK